MARKPASSSSSDPNHTAHPRVLMPRWIAWTLLAGAWLLLAAALASYDPADWPGHAVTPHHVQPANWVGRVGAFLAHKTYLMIGPGAWIFLVGVAVFLIASASGRKVSQLSLRAVGLVVMSLTGSALGALMIPGVLDGVFNRPEGAGGLVAIFANHELGARFGALGAAIILGVLFWIGAILAVDEAVLLLPRLIGRLAVALTRMPFPKPVLVGRFPIPWRKPVPAGAEAAQRTAAIPLRASGRLTGRRVEGAIDEDAGGLGATESFNPELHRAAAAVDDEQIEAEIDEEDSPGEAAEETSEETSGGFGETSGGSGETSGGDAPGAYVQQKRQFSKEELRAKIKQLPINFAPRAKSAPPPPREVDLSGYQFPGLELLSEPESNFTQEMEKVVRDQAVILEAALQQYRIEGEVVGIDSGPVITLYEVRLAPGTKVAALSAVSSDLARALKAQNIRIVPNMAGKDTVGIEVPNLKKEKVRIKELMTANPETAQMMKLPMYLGKDASGNPLIADLSTMPHMLIAGTTGSGKSVCMNSIIMSFLFTKRPDELKMVLVDPKMVEMSLFKDIPHLMCPVVTEMSKAAAILEWATTKMDERYELLAEAGVRDIAGYNALGADELLLRFNPSNDAEAAAIPKKLPYLVFVIDELADLIITNKEVEHFIVRIAQKARAVGIHLIVATQRPQANVVTGLIKSNMPCRVSFKVASGMDSRIVLDQKGAELLLGQGDMLYLSPRTSKLVRAQGTLVEDLEIRKTVRFLKEIAQQSFEPQLMQIKSPGASEEDLGERDPLFDDAVRIVLETKRGSVSLLQRRLTIGYSRASRLIEQMAQAGMLGDHKGSQAREVLMTLEEYEALRAVAQEDASSEASDAAEGGRDESSTDEAEQSEDAVPDELDGEYRQ